MCIGNIIHGTTNNLCNKERHNRLRENRFMWRLTMYIPTYSHTWYCVDDIIQFLRVDGGRFINAAAAIFPSGDRQEQEKTAVAPMVNIAGLFLAVLRGEGPEYATLCVEKR